MAEAAARKSEDNSAFAKKVDERGETTHQALIQQLTQCLPHHPIASPPFLPRVKATRLLLEN